MKRQALPVIAIVGRPNVGKSTLFNRLIGKRYAITSPVAGTTRDRIYHEAEIGNSRVILADTGGLEFEKKQDIEADIQAQARIAVAEADLIYFVVDASEPLTSSDYDAAKYLRVSSHKPLIFIAHKSDNKISEELGFELLELGLGEAIPVSSIHNMGLLELEIATKKALRKLPKPPKQPKEEVISLAMVGKPNVGKSSLVNALIGKERLIISPLPGTTIDATDTPVHTVDHGDFVLIDTAGLRKRGKVRLGIERYGHLRALQAISRCDIACLIIDYDRGIASQDLHVSQYILDAGCGVILVVNKSDLMEEPQKDQKVFLDTLHYRMGFIPWAPVLFVSALNKKHIVKIYELAKNIEDERHKKIPDDLFKVFTETTVLAHPPNRGGRKVLVQNGRQTGSAPPTFTFESNVPDLVHFSYRRFLENEIRRKFGYYGTAIRLEFVKSRR